MAASSSGLVVTAGCWPFRRRFAREARTLRTRQQPGGPEWARQLLGQALTTARQLGLTTIERRAGALLRDGP